MTLSANIDMPAIEAAAGRIRGIAIETPLLRNRWLDAHCDATVLLKAETLQHQGSFKIRGAWNCIDSCAEDGLEHGVVAWSSGNHAQGVALAAHIKGCPAVIVMPHDAPAAKRAATEALGAEVIGYDRYSEDREAIGHQIARERDALLVPSYDHPAVIAGQGTVGLEMATQSAALQLTPDAAIICCGGGGLAAGSAIAIHDRFPLCQMFVAEPEGFDDTRRSLVSDEPCRNSPSARSICDALLTPTPGKLSLPILKQHDVSGLVVSDAEVCAAMGIAITKLGLVVEPGGAAALAALLANRNLFAGQTVMLTLSGANADPALIAKVANNA